MSQRLSNRDTSRRPNDLALNSRGLPLQDTPISCASSWSAG